MKYILQSCYVIFWIIITSTVQADCLHNNNCEIDGVKLNDSYEFVKQKFSPCKEKVRGGKTIILDCVSKNTRHYIFFDKGKKAYRIHSIVMYAKKEDYGSIRKKYLALYGQPTLEAEAKTTSRNSSKGLIREMCWGVCNKRIYKKSTSSTSFSKSSFWSGSAVTKPKKNKKGNFLHVKYSEKEEASNLQISIINLNVH